MSDIYNPYAFSVLGSPAPLVAPPALRVVSGQATPEQIAMARDAFASFCAGARLSHVPHPAEIGRLPDGSTYRITDVAGHRVMQLWAVGGKPGTLTASGFVFFRTVDGTLELLVIDVKTAEGKHTGEWGVTVLPADKSPPYIYTDEYRGSLRPSIRGFSPHPYMMTSNYGMQHSVFGLAVGLPNGVPPYEHEVMHAEGNVVYSVGTVGGGGGEVNVVCTRTSLRSELALGAEAPAIRDTQEIVIARCRSSLSASIDYTFAGDRVMVERYATETVGAPDIETVNGIKYMFYTNPGLANLPYDPLHSTWSIGQEYETSGVFDIYERRDTTFTLTETLKTFISGEMQPPIGPYRVISQSATEVKYAQHDAGVLYVNAPDYPRAYTTWYISNLTLSANNSWKGTYHTTTTRPASTVATFSSSTKSLHRAPVFAFDGQVAALEVSEDYSYKLISSGHSISQTAGAHVNWSVWPYDTPPPQKSAGSYYEGEPQADDGIHSEGDSVQSEDANVNTVQDSYASAVCTVFGAKVKLLDNEARVVMSYKGDSSRSANLVTGAGWDGYTKTSLTVSVASRESATTILVYDPHLRVFCYYEYETTLNYTVSSSGDFVEVASVVTGTSRMSAWPRLSDIVIHVNRVVVEVNGRKVWSKELGGRGFDHIGQHVRVPNRAWGAADYDSERDPAALRPNPIPIPGVSSYPRGINGVVNPLLCNAYGHGSPVTANYQKSPCTGAALLQVDGEMILAIDKTGARAYSSVMGIAGLDPNTPYGWHIL